MDSISTLSSPTADSPTAEQPLEENIHWYAMRDLTRVNSKHPVYQLLDKLELRYFTPMVWKLVKRGRKLEKEKVPCIRDLIFVHESRTVIDPLVEQIPTFQYRFLRQRKLMTVRDADMERFIRAVESTDSPRYYRPNEVTPDMLKRPIRIIGGELDGYEGYLVTTRGSKTKRLLIELPSILAATVEVRPEFIQLLT